MAISKKRKPSSPLQREQQLRFTTKGTILAAASNIRQTAERAIFLDRKIRIDLLKISTDLYNIGNAIKVKPEGKVRV